MRTEQILLLLKTNGPMTAPKMAKSLGISSEGARLQLSQLAQQGLITPKSEAKGVGRPSQTYCLTAKGHARFPDTHNQLTLQLITNIRETLGEEALDKVIESREKEILYNYQQELSEATSLEGKVRQLANIRSREGYLAEVKKENEAWVLIENHCPICDAASYCQGFCRTELNTFRQLLGEDISIKRTEHIVKGARRCAYLIQQK